MMQRIAQLPALIANQIAAGEVVERPASVVKELLENSLDASATSIHIDIGYGGLNQIKVSDNGVGIHKDDLPLAVAAHATSKILCLDDLYAISSMGFRGEALASIAAVAKLKISSKPEQQETAMMLAVEGDRYNVMPCARAVGTTIEVNDLFFNAPVRKRFLKSAALEFQAIETVVKRFALSAPQVALSLAHNDKTVLSLPAALTEHTNVQRITKVLGTAFVKQAIELSVEQAGMALTGWISGKEYQRSQNDRLWVYINQRMVRDKLLHHALKQAYDGLLYPGRFPACLLYFTIDTKEVDVNVHPTKHEVRFQQPRLVHDFFTGHINKVLHAIETPKLNTQELTNTLCEPTALIERPQYYSPIPSFKNNYHVGGEASWTVLNKQYCIVWLENQPHLVNVFIVYQSWLQQLIEDQKPLISRPLLVTVRYPLTNRIKKQFTELKRILSFWGLIIECDIAEISVKQVPISMPYLDLNTLFSALEQLSEYSDQTVQDLMLQAQQIDASLLQQEERMALNTFIKKAQSPMLHIACKPLTYSNCQAFLDV